MKDAALKDLVLELNTKFDSMVERYDRHYDSNSRNTLVLFQKIDDIKDTQRKDKEELCKEIASVRLEAAKDSGATNAKIAGISGSVSLLVGIGMTWIKGVFAR